MSCKFVADVAKMLPKLHAFFGHFQKCLKKHENQKKSYAHKFYFLSAILKIYGKEE